MEAYKLVTQYNQNLTLWLNNLPIKKDAAIEIIVISQQEKEKQYSFTIKDIDELCNVHIPIDPLKFQKKMRNSL